MSKFIIITTRTRKGALKVSEYVTANRWLRNSVVDAAIFASKDEAAAISARVNGSQVLEISDDLATQIADAATDKTDSYAEKTDAAHDSVNALLAA